MNANLKGIPAVVNSLFMVLGEAVWFAEDSMLPAPLIMSPAEVVLWHDVNELGFDALEMANDAPEFAYDAVEMANDALKFVYDAAKLANDAPEFAYDAVVFGFAAAIFAYDRVKMSFDGLKMTVVGLWMGVSVIVAGNCLDPAAEELSEPPPKRGRHDF